MDYQALVTELNACRKPILRPSFTKPTRTPSSSQRSPSKAQQSPSAPPSPSKTIPTALEHLQATSPHAEYDALHASTLTALSLVPCPRGSAWSWRDDVLAAVRASGRGPECEKTVLGILEGRLGTETTSDGVRRELARAAAGGGVPMHAGPVSGEEWRELRQLLYLVLAVLDLRWAEKTLMDPAARSLRSTLRRFASDLLTPPPSPPSDSPDSAYTPTSEQIEITNSPITPGTTRILAFAGTGKTSSLLQLAERLHRDSPTVKVLYCCFNTSLRKEAEDKLWHLPEVTCQTTNSIAMRYLTKTHGDAFATKFKADPLGKGNLRTEYVVKLLGLTDQILETRQGASKPLRAKALANRIISSLERFAGTASPNVEDWHLHRPKSPDAAQVPDADLLKWTMILWDKIGDWSDPFGPLPFCVHVKLCLLDFNFRMGDYGVIMFDEAQDSNDADLELVIQQSAHARVLLVGDQHQAVYGWRGGTNRWLEKPADPVLRLSQSFRFGCDIANLANGILALNSEDVPLRGTSEPSRIFRPYPPLSVPPFDTDAPWTVLFRKNSCLVQTLLQYALQSLPLDLATPLPFVKLKISDTRLDGFFELYHHAHKLVMGHEGFLPKGEWSRKLAKFKTWDDVVEEAAAREKEEEMGAEDSELVELVGMAETLAIPEFGQLLSRVEASISKDPNVVPDLLLGTTHQVKGLEWDQVVLADDYADVLGLLTSNASKAFVTEEFNLLYVALTRSRSTLVMSDALFEVALIESGLHQFSLAKDCSVCMRCSSPSRSFIQYSTPFPPPPPLPSAPSAPKSSRSPSPDLFDDDTAFEDVSFPICLDCGSKATYRPLRRFAEFWAAQHDHTPRSPTVGTPLSTAYSVNIHRKDLQAAIQQERGWEEDFWKVATPEATPVASRAGSQAVKRERESTAPLEQEDKKPKLE